MRGVPLRYPYHLYPKKNKSVSGFSCLQTYYTRRKHIDNLKRVIIPAAKIVPAELQKLGKLPGIIYPINQKIAFDYPVSYTHLKKAIRINAGKAFYLQHNIDYVVLYT